MKKTKAEIKRVMKTQFAILTILIVIGAVIFGLQTNNWILSAQIAAGLFAATIAFGPLVYNKALQRAELFALRN